jgi:hypothetical protein
MDEAAVSADDDICTLLCVRPDGVSPVVDLTPWTDLGTLRVRAQRLLKEHGSAYAVELWRDGVLVERVVRAWTPPE